MLSIEEATKAFVLGKINIDKALENIEQQICSPGFSVEDFNWLSSALAKKIITVDYFFKLLPPAIEKFGCDLTKGAKRLFEVVNGIDRRQFCDGVIKLIIDNNGDFRFIGRHLWDKFSLHKSDFSVNDLNEDHKIRFVISMLQDIGNPEYRLPKVMPLFNDESVLVRRVLYVCLVNYCNNYFGFVKQSFDSLITCDNDEIRLFRDYCNNFDLFLTKRKNCKDLQPQYSQSDIYDEAARTVSRKMQDYANAIKQPLDQNSILKYFKPVCLARGGGWIDATGRVNSLSNVSVSLPYPMMVNAMSTLESIEFVDKMKSDWDKTMDICEIL